MYEVAFESLFCPLGIQVSLRSSYCGNLFRKKKWTVFEPVLNSFLFAINSRNLYTVDLLIFLLGLRSVFNNNLLIFFGLALYYCLENKSTIESS